MADQVDSKYLQWVLEQAEEHGLDAEPDHEVGDLQDALRVAFSLLTEEQQATAVSKLEEAGWGAYDADLDDDENE